MQKRVQEEKQKNEHLKCQQRSMQLRQIIYLSKIMHNVEMQIENEQQAQTPTVTDCTSLLF